MSGQPEPTESVSHRTVLPRIPGWPSGLLPWWGATLVAVTATLIGFAYDAGAGHQELGAVFATFYVLGCLAAVLLVRRGGVFTAIIQPPLILFVAVPTSYFLFHGGQLSGVKDILINCGYPLIERFPLMFFTSAAVLLIGLARWYLDKQSADSTGATSPTASALADKLGRLFTRPATTDADEREERPRPARRPRRAPTSSSSQSRRTRSGQPSRARHNRPPESDIAASAAAADRRERAAARERYRPRREDEPPYPGEPRQPREPRQQRRARDPRDPRDQREPRRRTPPPPRGYDEYERPRRRRESYDSSYPEYEPRYRERPDERYPEPPRRTAPPEDGHLPYSRVRYRRED